jgi:hypothetical protein
MFPLLGSFPDHGSSPTASKTFAESNRDPFTKLPVPEFEFGALPGTPFQDGQLEAQTNADLGGIGLSAPAEPQKVTKPARRSRKKEPMPIIYKPFASAEECELTVKILRAWTQGKFTSDKLANLEMLDAVKMGL